jgi:steroid delta-isomerase-like uncharacterized protein
VWNQRRVETIHELITPESFGHAESGHIDSAQAFLDLVFTPFVTAFPDLRLTVEDAVSEGDQVVVRWRATGTHTGAAMGLSATGTRVSFRGVTWIRLRDGKLMECWDSWNQHGLFQTLQGGPPAASVTVL